MSMHLGLSVLSSYESIAPHSMWRVVALIALGPKRVRSPPGERWLEPLLVVISKGQQLTAGAG